MEYICFIQILLCWAGTISATTRNHTGKEFVVAFFRELDLEKMDAYLLLTPIGNSNFTFTVLGLGKKNNLTSSKTIRPRTVEQFSFKKQFGGNLLTISCPVFRIECSHPVSVTAFIDYRFNGLNFSASYLALPLHVTAKEYRMMPVCRHSRQTLCVCTIVTLSANTQIVLKNENHGTVNVKASKYMDEKMDAVGMFESNPRTPLTLTLDYLNYVSLESQEDFTGLLVQASTRIAVFCGSTFRDQITVSMEQILPVPQYGRFFYPVYFFTFRSFQLKIIAHYNCTNIERSGTMNTLDAGHFLNMSLPADKPSSYMPIRSNKPIAVLQMYDFKSDEGLLILPAVDQYTQAVQVPTRNDGNSTLAIGFNNYICYSYTINNNLNKQNTVKYGYWSDTDQSGKSINVETPQKDCLECENTFGVYVLRRDIQTFGLSSHVAGYTFSSKKKLMKYDASPCVSKSTGNGITKSSAQISNDVLATKHNHKAKTTEVPETTRGKTTEEHTVTSTTLPTSCCPCHQTPKQQYKVLSEEELQERIRKMKEFLAINKKNLSSYRRKKISADDDRWSARGIGMVGACVLCAFGSIIFIMDFNTLSHQLAVLWRKTIA